MEARREKEPKVLNKQTTIIREDEENFNEQNHTSSMAQFAQGGVITFQEGADTQIMKAMHDEPRQDNTQEIMMKNYESGDNDIQDEEEVDNMYNQDPDSIQPNQENDSDLDQSNSDSKSAHRLDKSNLKRKI